MIGDTKESFSVDTIDGNTIEVGDSRLTIRPNNTDVQITVHHNPGRADLVVSLEGARVLLRVLGAYLSERDTKRAMAFGPKLCKRCKQPMNERATGDEHNACAIEGDEQ